MIEAHIKFTIINDGNVLATQPYVFITFLNVKEIVNCDKGWINISNLNKNIPTIRLLSSIPACPTIGSVVDGATVRVSKDIKQIEAELVIGADNMRFKEGKYIIPIQINNLKTGNNDKTL